MPNDTHRGFTLFELLVGMGLLALLLTLTAGFIFPVREKALLTRDTDQVTGLLELARQQSIAAVEGNSYSVVFSESNVSINPGSVRRQLSKNLQVSITPETDDISFAKRTGTPEQAYTIQLRSGDLESMITISTTGLIEQTPITSL